MPNKQLCAKNLEPSDGPFNWVGGPIPYGKTGVQVAIETADGKRFTKRNWPAEGRALAHANEFIKVCKANLVDDGDEDAGTGIDFPEPDGTSTWWEARLAQLFARMLRNQTKRTESALRTASSAARSAAAHIDTAALERKIEELEAEEENLDRRDSHSAESQETPTTFGDAPEPGVPIN